LAIRRKRRAVDPCHQAKLDKLGNVLFHSSFAG
jgi:hypothetical protein